MIRRMESESYNAFMERVRKGDEKELQNHTEKISLHAYFKKLCEELEKMEKTLKEKYWVPGNILTCANGIKMLVITEEWAVYIGEVHASERSRNFNAALECHVSKEYDIVKAEEANRCSFNNMEKVSHELLWERKRMEQHEIKRTVFEDEWVKSTVAIPDDKRTCVLCDIETGIFHFARVNKTTRLWEYTEREGCVSIDHKHIYWKNLNEPKID